MVELQRVSQGSPIYRLQAACGTVLRFLRAFAYLVLDSVSKTTACPRNDCALVVRLDAIGDFFVWLQSGAVDVARYARGIATHSVLIANSSWAEYARATELWDEVISIDAVRFVKSLLYRIQQLRRIRRLGASCLIQPRCARVFLLEDAIARVCGAHRRIGNSGTYLNTTPELRRLGNRFYTELIDVLDPADTHELIRNQKFAFALTGTEPRSFEFAPITRSDNSGDIVIALGAGEKGRLWPNEKLGALVRYILSTHPKASVTLVGRGEDALAAGYIIESTGGMIRNFVGKTSLFEYIEIIAGASVVICNESSAYHIAVARNKPVLCLVGGGHYGLFAPYPKSAKNAASSYIVTKQMNCFGCNWKCRFDRGQTGAFRCVESIELEDAIAGLEVLFAGASEQV